MKILACDKKAFTKGIMRISDSIKNSGDDNCVKNICYGAASTQIINRFVQSLQHGADGQRTGFALNCLIRIVPGIEIRKNENACLTGDLGVGHFFLSNRRIDGGVILDGAFNF